MASVHASTVPGDGGVSEPALEHGRPLGQSRRPGRDERAVQHVGIDCRRTCLDVVAEPVERTRRRLHGSAALGRDRRARPGVGRPANTHAAGLGAHLLRVGSCRRRNDVLVARARPVQGVQRRRGVAHRAAQDEVVSHAVQALPLPRADGNPRSRRLQARRSRRAKRGCESSRRRPSRGRSGAPVPRRAPPPRRSSRRRCARDSTGCALARVRRAPS